jgi:hypothetical protein
MNTFCALSGALPRMYLLTDSGEAHFRISPDRFNRVHIKYLLIKLKGSILRIVSPDRFQGFSSSISRRIQMAQFHVSLSGFKDSLPHILWQGPRGSLPCIAWWITSFFSPWHLHRSHFQISDLRLQEAHIYISLERFKAHFYTSHEKIVKVSSRISL